MAFASRLRSSQRNLGKRCVRPAQGEKHAQSSLVAACRLFKGTAETRAIMHAARSLRAESMKEIMRFR